MLWALLAQTYEQEGPRAWRPGGVPHQAVSNPVLAGACAEVIAAALLDLGPGDRPHPILELGAGAGRFGFFLVRALEALSEEAARAGQPLPEWRLVLVDQVEENLEFWAASSELRPFVESGRLDFALRDLLGDGPLDLLHSGAQIRPGEGPLIATANYLFDSLPADLFDVGRGRIGALYVSLESDVALETLLTRDRPLEAIRWSLHPRPVEPYGDAILDGLLERYRATAIEELQVLLPTGAIRCLEGLAGGAPLLLLSTDKGALDLQGLRWISGLQLAENGPIVSLAVNYHALGLYTQARGGFSLHPPHREPGLATVFSALGAGPDALPGARSAFARAFSRFSPRDNQRLLQMTAAAVEPEPELALRMLRLSGFDPHLLRFAQRALLPPPEDLPEWLRMDLLSALERTWENDYPLPDTPDLAFILGTLYQSLDEPVEALLFYERALERRGERAALRSNQGWCLLEIGQVEAARACCERALALDPGLTSAQRLREALEAA